MRLFFKRNRLKLRRYLLLGPQCRKRPVWHRPRMISLAIEKTLGPFCFSMSVGVAPTDAGLMAAAGPRLLPVKRFKSSENGLLPPPLLPPPPPPPSTPMFMPSRVPESVTEVFLSSNDCAPRAAAAKALMLEPPPLPPPLPPLAALEDLPATACATTGLANAGSILHASGIAAPATGGTFEHEGHDAVAAPEQLKLEPCAK